MRLQCECECNVFFRSFIIKLIVKNVSFYDDNTNQLIAVAHTLSIRTQMKTEIFDNRLKFNERIIRWADTLNFPNDLLVSIPFRLIIRFFLLSSLAIMYFIYLFISYFGSTNVKVSISYCQSAGRKVAAYFLHFSLQRNLNFFHRFEHLNATDWKMNENIWTN